jgi:hypothetical protein
MFACPGDSRIDLHRQVMHSLHQGACLKVPGNVLYAKELQEMIVYIFWICDCINYTFKLRPGMVSSTSYSNYSVGRERLGKFLFKASEGKVIETPFQ